MNTSNFTKRESLEAIVRTIKLSRAVLENPNSSEKLQRLATESLAEMTRIQDRLIDEGQINPARYDCYSKDDPEGYFEGSLATLEFIETCSTPAARAAGKRLRDQADKFGA